jgi:hypothetical protein
MEWFYEIYEDWKNQNIPSKHVAGEVHHGVFKGLRHRPKMPSDEYRNELKRVSRRETRGNLRREALTSCYSADIRL